MSATLDTFPLSATLSNKPASDIVGDHGDDADEGRSNLIVGMAVGIPLSVLLCWAPVVYFLAR